MDQRDGGTANGARGPEAPGSRTWLWALLLVASLHLLSAPGTWYITDQAECLYAARRLLDVGSLDLAWEGETVRRHLSWVVSRPGEPARSRLHPLVALTLAPLLLADRALGLEHPIRYGHLVHLQGHLFVLGALALAGWAVARGGGGARGALVAVATAGGCWPVWETARRGGPEPIMMFLLCLFAAGVVRERTGPGEAQRRQGTDLQVLAAVLLPWANPTGVVFSAVVAGAALLGAVGASGPPGPDLNPREARAVAVGAALGIGTLVLFWNHGTHQNWWAGGYALHGAVRLAETSRWYGAWLYTSALVRDAPVLVLLAALVLPRSGLAAARALALPGLLVVSQVVLFSAHFMPEPARRLSPVWPLWAMVVGLNWGRRRWPSPLPQALVALGVLHGLHRFFEQEGGWYNGPLGLHWPTVVWVWEYDKGWPLAATALPACALVLLAAWAATRLWDLLPDRPEGPDATGR